MSPDVIRRVIPSRGAEALVLSPLSATDDVRAHEWHDVVEVEDLHEVLEVTLQNARVCALFFFDGLIDERRQLPDAGVPTVFFPFERP